MRTTLKKNARCSSQSHQGGWQLTSSRLCRKLRALAMSSASCLPRLYQKGASACSVISWRRLPCHTARLVSHGKPAHLALAGPWACRGWPTAT